jgi:molybdate transport system ATP-binding protein
MSISRCHIQLQRVDFCVDAEFTIPAKGVLGIFGHSGSGKTTLLRCVAGLEKNVKGRIEVNGETWLDKKKSLSSQQRNIGYIFQESRLFPHLTVIKNLEYGAKRNPENNQNIEREYLYELLNIGHLLNRRPFQLSGGEKQRIAIGRALLKNPQMLLLDEPLASLDEKRKQEILPYLERLHEELNIPMLYVSHNMDEMLRLCDYMLVMEQGQVKFNGNIHNALVAPGSPLAKVENAVAVLEGTVSKQEKDFDISTVHTVNGNKFQVPGLLSIGKHVRLIIFASDVSVTKNKAVDSSILNIIEGVVSAVLDKKDGRVLLQINCNQEILLSLISIKSFQLLQLALNKKIYIQVKAVVTRGN